MLNLIEHLNNSASWDEIPASRPAVEDRFADMYYLFIKISNLLVLVSPKRRGLGISTRNLFLEECF